MIFKKLSWSIKRHPFLYKSRFMLLSKRSNSQEIKSVCYNDLNPKSEIPKYFKTINEQIFEGHDLKSDLERVQHLSIWLRKHIKGGSGLSLPSEAALKKMLTGEGGVCSDLVQIFNNFCVINNILVREWGVTRAPFNKEFGGHSFNEIYSKELEKWILIDVSWSVLFYDEDKVPLSVIELYDCLRNNKTVTYNFYYKNKEVDKQIIERNYLNSDTIPFLICDYKNKTYDVLLKSARPHIPVFVLHFMLYLFNKSYHYRFPLDDYRKIFS